MSLSGCLPALTNETAISGNNDVSGLEKIVTVEEMDKGKMTIVINI